MTVSSFTENRFLSNVSVFRVGEDGAMLDSIGAPIERLAGRAIESGGAEISCADDSTFEDSSAAIAIPIHRNGHVSSVAVLSARQLDEDQDNVVGVFEVWEPIGIYAELALSNGYFGKMERFRNVSSFVRFEKGMGLPGQVWQQRMGVVHDDLSNHPGFLRAAGTSADLLIAAVGIPVASTAFHSAALLISSTVSPLARGIEVWQAQDDCFELVGGAYHAMGEGVELPPEARFSLQSGLPGLARQSGGAVLCDDSETIYAGRNHDAEIPESPTALAIPFFDGDTLTSVTALLF